MTRGLGEEQRKARRVTSTKMRSFSHTTIYLSRTTERIKNTETNT